MNNSAPTIFTIMGITGDLAQNKLLPALLELYIKNALPKRFEIIGFGRRNFSKKDFEEFIGNALTKKNKYTKSQIGSFIERTRYVKGDFDNQESFNNLKLEFNAIDKSWGQCSNKLIYLSVPPKLYSLLFDKIAKSGLSEICDDDTGWTRILVEKPFGSDDKEAQKLEKQLSKLFKEEQIFRIDHYLAKEVLQNILTFRFCNTMFEPLWNKDNIESVHIHFFESNDADKRAVFGDGLGALRDVGQNHMLQMLSLVAMEKPKNLGCSEVRKERSKLLSSIQSANVKDLIYRGQYEGYLDNDGIESNSKTETFFSLIARINNKRWKGVPFHLVSGKALNESRVEIKIVFKDPDPAFFVPQEFENQEKNTLVFRIQPHEGIGIVFWFKVPGFESRIESKTLKFNYSDSEDSISIPDAYERVIFDCITGDQTLFTSTKEVLASWKYISSVSKLMPKVKLNKYKRGENPINLGKK